MFIILTNWSNTSARQDASLSVYLWAELLSKEDNLPQVSPLDKAWSMHETVKQTIIDRTTYTDCSLTDLIMQFNQWNE